MKGTTSVVKAPPTSTTDKVYKSKRSCFVCSACSQKLHILNLIPRCEPKWKKGVSGCYRQPPPTPISDPCAGLARLA
eukprot:110672-Pelagomonas_calceolata.AAC.2